MTDLGLPQRREAPADAPREWIEFVDPADPAGLVRADLTWLLSSWTCIYGRGCEGIERGRADDGCCTHGAFYADEADRLRIESMAAQLKSKHWQYAAAGRELGVSETDGVSGADGTGTDGTGADGGEPAVRTRLVDGACVFLNRPGFSGGAGCALHALADRRGLHPLRTKPDVCWQLPVRRTQDWVERPDEVSVLVTTIGEFDRRAWGPGGADLHWWCTSSPAAHVGAEPLWAAYEAELTELLGAPAYAELAHLCRRRAAGAAPTHPAAAPAYPSG